MKLKTSKPLQKNQGKKNRNQEGLNLENLYMTN